jgi:uncharacterized membrane protein
MLSVLLIAFTGCAKKTSEPVRTRQSVDNLDLVIQIADITEIVLFCPVEIDGTKMEVLAVRAPDGTIRTAFNTCEGCLEAGAYFAQEGTVLVCQICGDRYRMGQIEVEKPAGTCNPVPIFPANKTVTGSTIPISSEYLRQSKGLFAKWKQSPAGNTGGGAFVHDHM